MVCPHCKQWANNVEIRRTVLRKSVRRLRQCGSCNKTWSTYERAADWWIFKNMKPPEETQKS
jgi:transcriptional regulator NrdR family protein